MCVMQRLRFTISIFLAPIKIRLVSAACRLVHCKRNWVCLSHVGNTPGISDADAYCMF